MDPSIASCLDAYSPISLDALNAKAAMLERIDNKYIMPAARLRPALEQLSDTFDVLDIEGRRAFSYATRYFDDAEKRGYYDHHQRRRKRCKARVRHYVDADFSFLEVKLNEQRSMTAKRRMKVGSPLDQLDAPCMDFVQQCYRDCYREEFSKTLIPAILIQYQRITLVAKEGGERLTIDTGMSFEAGGVRQTARPDMFIIETKSANGNGIADKIFRALHAQPTKRVSKFCIGMAVTGQVVRHNGFLPALRKLDLLEAPAKAASQLSVQQQPRSTRIMSHAPTPRPLAASGPRFSFASRLGRKFATPRIRKASTD